MLASDYEHATGKDGLVDEPARQPLRHFKQSRRIVLLISGRELPQSEASFGSIGFGEVFRYRPHLLEIADETFECRVPGGFVPHP
jgi:hypothetical protein